MAENLKDNIEAEELEKSPKQRGLGRGLDALFGDEENEYKAELAQTEEIKTSRRVIGIEQIVANEDQPRRHFDEDALKELAQSIETYGLLQPILVRPSPQNSEQYQIVAGERRWRAAQKAQLHEIPVIIKELTDEETYQIALVENLQRRDLNPIEEALGYQKLIVEFDYLPEAVGKLLGRSRSHVANMIRLLELPESVQVMLEVGDISMGHARALLNSDEPETVALYVIEKGLSVRDTEKLAAQLDGRDVAQKIEPSKARRRTGFADKDADTLALEKEVSDQIGMHVSIDMKNDHKGRMQIEFESLDQLDDVLQRLAQTPKY
ncbi:MAG: ParB/RepB/Spo0J family partition protein [Pseudomonadota bacterium]